ncbi:MAG: FAD-binding protein [Pseudomonadota bacterium]
MNSKLSFPITDKLNANTLKTFGKRLDGNYYLPFQEQYHNTCSLDNGAIDHKPTLVVLVASINDIEESIKFAVANNLRISVKCGGHMPSGKAIKTKGLVIDMCLLNKVDVCYQANKQLNVLVDGGALIGDADRCLNQYGLLMTNGISQSVGIAGFTLGGGLSLLSRKYGLAIDSLLNAELLLSDAKPIQVNEKINSDLFWAIKGAGHCNFGVVTKLEFRTFDTPKTFHFIIAWSITQARQVLNKYNQYMSSASDNILIYCAISRYSSADTIISFSPSYVRGEMFLVMEGFYYGNSISQADLICREVLSWGKACVFIKSDKSIFEHKKNYDEQFESNYLKKFWKSGILYGDIDDVFITIIVDYFDKYPHFLGRLVIEPLGGAIQNVSLTSSAFIHRQANFVFSIKSVWMSDKIEEAQANIQWLNKLFDLLKPYYEYSYQNYDDNTLCDPLTAYYGKEKQKLIELKHHYDPVNLFSGIISP